MITFGAGESPCSRCSRGPETSIARFRSVTGRNPVCTIHSASFSALQNKVQAVAKHMSQFSDAWNDYRPELSPENQEAYMNRIRERVMSNTRNGTVVESFRYYSGIPDGIGSREGY